MTILSETGDFLSNSSSELFRDRVLHEVQRVGHVVRSREWGFRNVAYWRGIEPTAAGDLIAERLLQDGLGLILPGARFVSEEGAPVDVIDRGPRWTWIVDPIDGTSCYVRDEVSWGIQVALCRDGRTVGAWIVCPDLGWSVAACDQAALKVLGVSSQGSARRVIASGDFDREHRDRLQSGGREYRGTKSCAVDYAEFAGGQLDALVYRRTRPWDHAPGAYLAMRAGGSARRWDGTAYLPSVAGEGLVVTRAGVDELELLPSPGAVD